MAKYRYLKLPSYRSTASQTPSPEVFEIVFYDGEYVALLKESPADPTISNTPMVVTVNGNARTYQNDSNPVSVGNYKIKYSTVIDAQSNAHSEFWPVLVFNSADAGLTGTCSYYRTGTVITPLYEDHKEDFSRAILGYDELVSLSVAYPPTSGLYTRGYPGDRAYLTDMTPVASDGTEWKLTGASTVNVTPVLAAIGAQYLTTGAALDISVSIVDEDPAGCEVTASSSNTTVCPLNKLSVTGSGASRTLHIAALSSTGTSTITVTVQDAQGAQSQQEFTLNAIATVTYTVSVSTTGIGTVSPGTVTLPSGTNQSFSIAAGTGYHIQDVTLDGVSQGAVSTVSLSNLQVDHTIGATFAVNTYVIDTSQTGSGTVSPDQTVNYGDSYSVTGTAGTDQFIKDVVIDGTSHLGAQSSPYTYTGFNSISAAHTIQFVFGNTVPSWVSSTIESYTAAGFVVRFRVNDPESQVLTVQRNVDSGGWASPASGTIKRVSDNATVEYNAIASGVDYRLTVSGLSGASHMIDLRVNDGVNIAVQLSAPLNATIPAPSTPVISVAGGSMKNTINLASGGSPASSYNIKWGTSAGSRSNTITGVTLPYDHTGRNNATTYYYSVVAVNEGGSTESSEASGTTSTLAAPTGHSVDAGNTQVTLHPGTSSNAASYNAYYTSDGSTPTTGSTKITGVTNGQVLGSLTNGVTYKFVFEAVNAGGVSALSTVVSSTPTTMIAAEFAGAEVDSRFSAQTYGSGSVSVSSGQATISVPSSGDAAIIRYDTALPTNKVYTIDVKGQINGSDVTNMTLLSVVQQASAPGPASTNDSIIQSNARIDVVLRPTSGYLIQYKNGTGQYPRWTVGNSTWNTGTAFTSGLVAGTQYITRLESDGAQFRITILNATGTTNLVQTSWVNWSSVLDSSYPFWFYVGDPNTEWNTTNISIDYIRVS